MENFRGSLRLPEGHGAVALGVGGMPTPQLLKIIVEKGGAKYLRAYGRQNSKSGPAHHCDNPQCLGK